MVEDGGGTNGDGVAGLSHRQFRHSADVAGLKLRDLDGVLASQHVDLAHFLLSLFIYIVDGAVRLQSSGTDLHQRIFSNKRVHNGLEHSRGQGYVVVVFRSETLAGGNIHAHALILVGSREVADDGAEKNL